MKVIGIDPGTTTGFALAKDGELEIVTSGTFYEMVNLAMEFEDEAIIVVEDARMRKWYGNKGTGVLQGVGMVKRDCKLWEEWGKHRGWNIKFIHPKNIKTKLKAHEFKMITGWEGQTNEHKRDAGMIAFQYNPKLMG